MVKTHRDYLIENHGLDPRWNPRVQCACGRFTSADMCVDVGPLPAEMRQALGLERIDYLCDGCVTRLCRDQLVYEDEFYALLGADVEALFIHNARDREHASGLAERHAAQQPQFDRVTLAKVADKPSSEITRSRPIVPVQFVEMRNAQSAQYLAYKYRLTNVELPPDVARQLLEVEGEAGASVTEPDVDISPAA